MRKIIIMLLSLLFIITISYANQESGAQLHKWGIVNGDLMSDSELTREMAITYYIRLLGEQKAAMDFNGEMSYTDVPKNHWSYKYIAYAEAKKYTHGLGNRTFGLGQMVTYQQMVAFMLRGLGYLEVAYGNAVEEGYKLGVILERPINQQQKLIRGDSFTILSNTLNVARKDGVKALKYELGFEKAPIVIKPQPIVIKPEPVKIMKLLSASLSDYRMIEVLIDDEMGSNRDISEKTWHVSDGYGNMVDVVDVIKAVKYSGGYNVLMKLKDNLIEGRKYYITYGDLNIPIDEPYTMPIPPIGNVFTILDHEVEVAFSKHFEEGEQWTYTIYDLDKNDSGLTTSVKISYGTGMGRIILKVNGVLTGDRYKLVVERISSSGSKESQECLFDGPVKVSPGLNNTAAIAPSFNIVEVIFPSKVNIESATFTIKEENVDGELLVLSRGYINDKTIQLQTENQKPNKVYQITISGVKDYNGQMVAPMTLQFASRCN